MAETIRELAQKSAKLDFLVGFFSISGLAEIYKAIGDKPTRILIGISNRFNEGRKSEDEDPEAKVNAVLFWAEKFEKGQLEIRKTREENHSKMYIFSFPRSGAAKEDRGRVLMGSSNLSRKGLLERNEMNVLLKSNDDFDHALENFERFWNAATPLVNEKHDTILKWAEMFGVLETVDRLLDKKTFLIKAIRGGNLDVANILIEKGVDVNVKDEDGNTALMLATKKGYFDVVKLLVEKGANVNAKSNVDSTALDLAVTIGDNSDIPRFLLEKGAQVNAKVVGDDLAMFIRAIKRQDLNTAKRLLYNATVKRVDSTASDTNGTLGSSERLPQRRVWPFRNGDFDGGKSLLRAIRRRNIKSVRRLLEEGAKVNTLSGCTMPIIAAIQEGELDIAELLLDHGADVNAQHCRGGTALMCAVKSHNLNTVEFLISHGADVNAKNGYDDMTALMMATQNDNWEIVELLVSYGANVNAKNKKGETPLYYAVSKNNLKIAKFLIEKGANVNSQPRYGYTPLMEAASKSNLDIVKLLLENSADVNAKTESGTTALSAANGENRSDIKQVLRANGATTDMKPFFELALSIAIMIAFIVFIALVRSS